MQNVNHDRMVKILFFHGGPGLNSNPENKLLRDRFAQNEIDLICWNEPSALRVDGPTPNREHAYGGFLSSAEDFLLAHYDSKPLTLMAHSFGAHPACFLAKKHPDKIAKIIFISTDIGLPVTDRNMFTFSMLDFKEHGDALHLELQKVLDRYTGKFDLNAEKGFELFVQNPRWFDY
jgi:pimeloyl-ACP methyl ester carboxylesterase